MSFSRTKLMLSIQRALLGAVTPALRMVTAEGDENEIRLIFYYEGEITEEINELAETAASEIIASFSNQTLKLSIIRSDYPSSMRCLTEIAYKRLED